MKSLTDVIDKVEVVTGIPRIDIEVFFKINDKDGCKLAFARRRDDSKYDLYSLKKKVPGDAWETTDGVKEAFAINEGDNPYHSIGDDFNEVIGDIVSNHGLTLDDIEVIYFEIKDSKTIQIVLKAKSNN